MANPLASCVNSLQSTTQLLGSTISILDSGVHDYPRLAKVLRTTRHFELLPESTLQTAQSSLLSSLTPELNTLLLRVEAHLDKLDRRSQSLAARCELLEGRLSTSGRESGGVRRDSVGAKGGKGAGGTGRGDEREVQKMKQLKVKKERLAYAVETLELQARQKERQLRMSVAAS